MKLLFDEQLSERLLDLLSDVYPGSLHVRTLDAGGASDKQVWALAQQHGCVLVTKDEDFHRMSVLRGAPPHVIWIRLGNCPTQDIEDLLRTHPEALRRLTEHDEVTFLSLG